MRPSVFSEFILMVSLSNHGQHHFFCLLLGINLGNREQLRKLGSFGRMPP